MWKELLNDLEQQYPDMYGHPEFSLGGWLMLLMRAVKPKLRDRLQALPWIFCRRAAEKPND
jgi:hypothetical protein